MQFNVLQWQAFHMYQYFYTDHASPSQRAQAKSTASATYRCWAQEGEELLCPDTVGDVRQCHLPAAPSAPQTFTHAQTHPNRSLQRASLLTSTCHASIRHFGQQRGLWNGVQDRGFLWCHLLEIGGTPYSSYSKGHEIVSFPTLTFSSSSFDPKTPWVGVRVAVVRS